MNRADWREIGIDNTSLAAAGTSAWRGRANNRRRPWHQRLVRKVNRFLLAHDVTRHPSPAWEQLLLLLCSHLYLAAALSAWAFGAWAPALILSLGSLGSFTCHHRRLTRWPHPHASPVPASAH